MTNVASWVSVCLFALGPVACGSRVSVGDQGGAGSPIDDPSAGGSIVGTPTDGGFGNGGSTAVGGSGGSRATTAGSGGDAGSDFGECAQDFDLSVYSPVATAICPETKPSDGDPCSQVETAACIWQWDPSQHEGNSGFETIGCFTSLTGSGQRWWKKDTALPQGTTEPSSADPTLCPLTVPTNGTTCADHAGRVCRYPFLECTCKTGEAWDCAEPKYNSVFGLLPVPVEPLCPPANVDERQQVKDLSDEEALAWCQWFARPGGRADVPLNPKDPNDVSNFSAAIAYPFDEGICLPELPFSICVKNLRTQPCTATVRELDECLETISVLNGQGWVGRGCGPLLSNPTCNRIIVQPFDRKKSKCAPVPIE